LSGVKQISEERIGEVTTHKKKNELLHKSFIKNLNYCRIES